MRPRIKTLPLIQDGTLLDEILATTEVDPDDGPGAWVGEVVDVDHPRFSGRVLVSWTSRTGAHRERWVPALQGLSPRRTDLVLMSQPGNWAEPVVTGVVDGYTERESARIPAAALCLQPGETLRVEAFGGAPLVEIAQSTEGPVVRVLHEDAQLELEGRLRIRARSIELRAREGDVSIQASDRVVVQGETIDLN